MKTYDIDFRKGTFTDSVNNLPLTITQGELSFCKLPKGFGCINESLAGFTIVDTGILASDAVGADATMELWIKTGSDIINTQYLAMIPRGTGSTFMSILIASTQLKFYFANNTGGVDTVELVTPVEANREYHIIFERDNTSNLNIYIDNILVDSATIGGQSPSSSENMSLFGIQSSGANPNEYHHIYRYRTYNRTLTKSERNEAYIEFLNSYSPIETKSNFQYPKPTDLSHVNGLVAAYNMIPSCGGVLTDISGNGNNGTINGALSTVNGMEFNGVDSNITRAAFSEISVSRNFSMFMRIKVNKLTTSQQLMVNGNSSADRNGFTIAGSRIAFESYNGSTYKAKSSVVQEGQIYNLVGVGENNNLTFYINGIKVSETTPNNTLGYTFNGFAFGSDALSLENFADCEIMHAKVTNYTTSAEEAKAYHNSFIQPIVFETFEDRAVDQYPDTEWIKDSGDAKTTESIERGKYLLQTSSGINEIFICEKNTNVTASIDYYDGASWATYTDTLANLIFTYSWINLDGKKLQFILDAGEAIDNVIVLNGIKQ